MAPVRSSDRTLPLAAEGAAQGSGTADSRRVLYVSHTGRWGGGAEVVLEQMMRAGREQGYTPYLACPRGELEQRLRPLCAGVAVLPMPHLRRTRNPISLLAMFGGWLVTTVRLVALIRGTNPDVVHANSGVAALTVAVAGVITRLPLIWHQHDIVPPRWVNRLVMGACASLASRVVPCSRAVATSLERLGVPAEKMYVLYNSVRAEFVNRLPDRQPARRELNLPSGVPVLTVIGRLVPRKGQDVFLRALSSMVEAGSHAVGQVVGEAESRESAAYAARLHELADTPPLQGRVRFLGRRDDIPVILAASDVVVMPSSDEPFPLVILEAFAAGIPVVASDSGGHPEMIDEGTTGLLVPVRDHAALARAVQRLLADSRLRDGIVANARARVLSQFSERALGPRLDALYASVIPASRAQPRSADA